MDYYSLVNNHLEILSLRPNEMGILPSCSYVITIV